MNRRRSSNRTRGSLSGALVIVILIVGVALYLTNRGAGGPTEAETGPTAKGEVRCSALVLVDGRGKPRASLRVTKGEPVLTLPGTIAGVGSIGFGPNMEQVLTADILSVEAEQMRGLLRLVGTLQKKVGKLEHRLRAMEKK